MKSFATTMVENMVAMRPKRKIARERAMVDKFTV